MSPCSTNLKLRSRISEDRKKLRWGKPVLIPYPTDPYGLLNHCLCIMMLRGHRRVIKHRHHKRPTSHFILALNDYRSGCHRWISPPFCWQYSPKRHCFSRWRFWCHPPSGIPNYASIINTGTSSCRPISDELAMRLQRAKLSLTS